MKLYGVTKEARKIVKKKVRAYMLPVKDEHVWVRRPDRIGVYCDHCYEEYEGMGALALRILQKI